MTREEAIEELKYIKESFAQCEESHEALDMAIKTLEETHWIPCNERLPELYERVLVTDGEDVEMSKLSRMSDDGYIWLFETCWNDLKDWPYWMPLPEPWEGDKE